MSSASLHIEKARLGLSDAKYRAILREIAGVSSSKELTQSTDRAVYLHLKRLGSAQTRAGRFFWVQWTMLQSYLPAKERTGAYCCGFIRKATGVRIDDLSMLDQMAASDLRKANNALKIRIGQEEEKASSVPF